MQVAVFSTRAHDRQFLDTANEAAGSQHDIRYFEAHLNLATAGLAEGASAICPFVNDQIGPAVLKRLSSQGVRLVALRGAGFNNVDLAAAEALGIKIGRVPAYSPYAIAEHAIALILSLNRKIYRAYARVREGNFSLDGLLGFDLHGKTVGIVGTGRIGITLARIVSGFGCEIVGADPVESAELRTIGGRYVSLDELLACSDIVTLHCPLTPETRHLIGPGAVAKMKRGVMLINTSRGAVVDTRAIIDGLKAGKIGNLGLDVYEEEGDLFFEDLSDQVIQDDAFARLLTFPNVLITGHQAFFTREALQAIAETTIANLTEFEASGCPLHPVSAERHVWPSAST
jgi:D-lactate dehydrogenase